MKLAETVVHIPGKETDDWMDPKVLNDSKSHADRLASHFSEHNAAHASTVKLYTGYGSRFINAYHLHKAGVDISAGSYRDPQTIADARDADGKMQAMMKDAPALPVKSHFYSGVGQKLGKHLATLKPGDPLHSPAYISYSTSPLTAYQRGIQELESGDGDSINTPARLVRHVIHGEFEAGSRHGAYVGTQHSAFPAEREFVSNRGLQYEYVGSHEHVHPPIKTEREGTWQQHITVVHTVRPVSSA